MPKVNWDSAKQIKATLASSFKLLKLAWSVDPKLILMRSGAMLMPAIIPFINIYIYKLIIDLIVNSISSSHLDLNKLVSLILVRLLTYFLQELAFAVQIYTGRLLWLKFPIAYNKLILTKISKLDYQYFEDSDFKNLLERVRDASTFRPLNSLDFFFYTLQGSIQLLIAAVAIGRLNIFLLLLLVMIAIPEFLNQARMAKFTWGVWTQNSPLRKRYWYLNDLLQRAHSVKELKLYKVAGKFIDELTDIQQKFYLDNKILLKNNFLIGSVFKGLSTLTYIGIESFIFLEAITRKITIGDIGFFTGMVNNFQNALSGFFKNVNDLFENGLYIQSIFELLEAKPRLVYPENPIKLNLKSAPRIEFNKVNFAYPGSKQKILNAFSLVIEPGEKIAFVGENGAGKTTLIKLLSRFYDVDEGEILIDGKNIKDLDLDSWYKVIGVLFQDFEEYEHTVSENIHFGNIEQPKNLESIIEAAVSGGAHSMIQKLDKKYEQMLGKTFEEGIELSGGQWQKLALSRAFFRNAPVLVLDEPTAAIDAKAESEIFGRVERLSKDKTVIIISHRFSTVRNADKIYVIDNGQIKESGSHEELIKLDGQYATLFKLQAKGYQ